VGADGVLLVDAGRLAGVLRFGGYRGRIVGVEHGDVLAVATLPLPLRVKDRLERWVGARFRFADVGVSDFVAAEMHRRPHASRLYRIHNGVDTSLYRPHRADAPSSESRLTIGCAARLVRGKGVDRLLAAVGRLSRDTVRVLVAGDGPEQESLEKLARTLGLADIVTFLGAVEDMPGFWRSCDVAVVPSEALESFSMATLEAMASGIPVVATSVGGIPEVLVHGETGTIVPPRDADALAHAIRSYAEQPARRVQEGRAGRLRACRLFSIETAAARYLELFKEDRTS
jgi:glycosyltransferase involved in cell wall biosynthesis